jgi:threonine synthase
VKYISTRGHAPHLSFEDALLAGLATDGGLYVPESWPRLSEATLRSFVGADYATVAKAVLHPFMADDVSAERLSEIVDEAYACFTHPEVAPLVPLEEGHYLLELFHGPTLAFKDVAMQLLARLMDDALQRRGQRATIVGATSGDTGGAAIEAFKGRDAVDIFILYPEGRVSDVQRKQMTTLEDANVHTMAVKGTFDDCQALVKGMFNDESFRQDMSLAGVNSINWARVMAQTVYYFTAAAQLGAPDQPVAFSVPTGNFGDIFAGYVAAQMGLPISHLMVATNVNDILARTLQTGIYETGEVVATSSPSMDIQVSSNFERLLFELTHRDASRVRGYMEALSQSGRFEMAADELTLMRALFGAERIDQADTLGVMRDIKAHHGMQIDPHSAIGVGAARRAFLAQGVPIVSLATAHPAKFPKAVHEAYDEAPDTPQRVLDMLARPEHFTPIDNHLADVQAFIRATTQR